jgi:hypothetical protein
VWTRIDLLQRGRLGSEASSPWRRISLEEQAEIWRHSEDESIRYSARGQLISQYVALVWEVAMHVHASWTAPVMIPDLRTGSLRPVRQGDFNRFAMFGLCDSIANYEPGHDDGFEAYARLNIERVIRYELEALENDQGMLTQER